MNDRDFELCVSYSEPDSFSYIAHYSECILHKIESFDSILEDLGIEMEI